MSDKLKVSQTKLRGRWLIEEKEDGTRVMHCTNCMCQPINKIIANGSVIWHIKEIEEIMHYCPICGAKMGNLKKQWSD